jgi:hypothetical protein
MSSDVPEVWGGNLTGREPKLAAINIFSAAPELETVMTSSASPEKSSQCPRD